MPLIAAQLATGVGSALALMAAAVSVGGFVGRFPAAFSRARSTQLELGTAYGGALGLFVAVAIVITDAIS